MQPNSTTPHDHDVTGDAEESLAVLVDEVFVLDLASHHHQHLHQGVAVEALVVGEEDGKAESEGDEEDMYLPFGISRHRAWVVGMRPIGCSLGSLGRLLVGLLEAVSKPLGPVLEPLLGPFSGAKSVPKSKQFGWGPSIW